MKFLCLLVILGFLSACNEKETEIIELEPPITPIQEEVERIVEVAPSYRELAEKPCTIACDEVEEIAEEIATVETTEEII
tara:strand:+ start:1875 stop:2114 length:240 start_codon:yes stop_codon:yes gene_type:complete